MSMIRRERSGAMTIMGPEFGLDDPKRHLRPAGPHLVQIQVDDPWGAYSLFLHPDSVEDFTDPEVFRRAAFKALRERVSALLDDFQVDLLLERGWALACNFRLANIDAVELTTYVVR